MIPKKGNADSSQRFLFLPRLREDPLSDSLQRRALYCASLVSLGALCTGMIILRVESGARLLLLSRVVQKLGSVSLALRHSLCFAFPLALVLLGLLPLGPAFLAALDIVFGAASFLVFSSCLFTGPAPLIALLFIPAMISSVFLSASVFHLSGMLFRLVISGGRFRPDLRPVVLRVFVFTVLFELTMFFFWNVF